MPVNLAQGVESFVLAYLGEGDAKKALIYGGSTLLATFAGDLGMGWFEGAEAEKFATEPIVAGILSSLGMYAFAKKEKNNIIKPFAKGLAYTGASAGLNLVFADKYIDRKINYDKLETIYDKAGNPMCPAVDLVNDSGYSGLRTVVSTKKSPGFFESNSLN